MKSKMPEIVALILLVLALLVPPWKRIIFISDGHGVYETEWALVFVGPSRVGQIDIVLLLVELLVIAGMYFLLALIVKPSRN